MLGLDCVNPLIHVVRGLKMNATSPLMRFSQTVAQFNQATLINRRDIPIGYSTHSAVRFTRLLDSPGCPNKSAVQIEKASQS